MPPFYKDASVIELAARLRADASQAGVNLGELERPDGFAIEQIILAAMNARLAAH